MNCTINGITNNPISSQKNEYTSLLLASDNPLDQEYSDNPNITRSQNKVATDHNIQESFIIILHLHL